MAVVAGFVLLPASPALAKPNPKHEADLAIAKKSVLVIADFPSGWRTHGASNKEFDKAFAQTRKCKAYLWFRSKARSSSARADSPEFAQDDQMYVDSTVYVFADDQAATKAVRKVHRTDLLHEVTLHTCDSHRVADAQLSQNDLNDGNVLLVEVTRNRPYELLAHGPPPTDLLHGPRRGVCRPSL